jgi:hypothetical protein
MTNTAHPYGAGVAAEIPISPAREIFNRIEARSNLVYLIKQGSKNADEVSLYAGMAESELSRLADAARLLFLEAKPWSNLS